MKKYIVKYRLQIRHRHAYGYDRYVVEDTIVSANTFAEARAKVKNNDSDIKILSVERRVKKEDCVHYEMIIDYECRIGLDGEPFTEPILVDEVCSCKEKGGPLHHNEYDCETCLYYAKEKEE